MVSPRISRIRPRICPTICLRRRWRGCCAKRTSATMRARADTPRRSARWRSACAAGLVDGELPARPNVDPLLSDEERRAVNRAARRPVFRLAAEGADAGLLPPRQAEEPLLFHLALCAARTSATLLWPRADAQG